MSVVRKITQKNLDKDIESIFSYSLNDVLSLEVNHLGLMESEKLGDGVYLIMVQSRKDDEIDYDNIDHTNVGDYMCGVDMVAEYTMSLKKITKSDFKNYMYAPSSMSEIFRIATLKRLSPPSQREYKTNKDISRYRVVTKEDFKKNKYIKKEMKYLKKMYDHYFKIKMNRTKF